MRQLKSIVILILFIFIVYHIFGNSEYSLACGIFAWVGKDVKFFRRDFFNILGMYNDSRGGDSCGIYYDNYWVKGIGDQAKYEKLVPKYDLHNTLKLKEYPVVIGHTRKTSVGSTTLDNAQPVVLEDVDDNLLYVQAHNGTISNYYAIAKKHKVELLPRESDSIAMARLIEEVGFDVLGEYEGSGAFVMYFKKEPTVLYAFHGRSKLTEYATVTSDERPLAYLTYPGKGTYISSDIAHLGNIASKGNTPVEFKYNVLYKLEGDTVTEVREIDRSKVFPVVVTKPANRASSYDLVKKSLLSYIGEHANGGIRFNKGLYQTHDRAGAHGVYIVDSWGYIVKGLKIGSSRHYELCFIHGLLMKDRESYETMMSYLESKNILTFDKFHAKETFQSQELIIKLKNACLFPFSRYQEDGTSVGSFRPMCMPDPTRPQTSSYYYDGLFRPLFSRYEFRLWNGDVTWVTNNKALYTVGEFLQDEPRFTHSFNISSTEDVAAMKNKFKKKTTSIYASSNDDCGTCELFKDSKDYCDIYCYGRKQPLVTAETPTEGDKAYEKAYAEYDATDANSQLAKEVLLTELKEVYKVIENCIDTYDGVAQDLGDECEEELEIIKDLRTISLKINKY